MNERAMVTTKTIEKPGTAFNIARFLLDAPVLPLVTNTVPVAEAFRNAVMSQFNRWCNRHPDLAEPFRRPDKPDQFSSRTLSGKELNGAIRKDHCHAFYLPTADGDDGRWITHVTVTATEGFGPGEVAALNAVRTLKLDDESAELRVQLVGLGSQQDFRAPLLAESAIWVSATPYLATRYLKSAARRKTPPNCTALAPGIRPTQSPPGATAPPRLAASGFRGLPEGEPHRPTPFAAHTVQEIAPQARRRRQPSCRRGLPHRLRPAHGWPALSRPFVPFRDGLVCERGVSAEC